ncbi:MAG TPA: APC family permease [Steroidobacteraceae bacterium]|jgi:APA family basic amino acid/polyamine antiporter|nr:APC family permease [Steroidobacteraceae bacterium]
MPVQRDQGLVRALGPWSMASSIFSMIVGAGIFATPAELAHALGAWAPLAILGCAVAVGAVGICCAEACSRIPTSGGIYGCVEAAYGPLPGFVCGMVLAVSDVLACGGVAAALASVVATLAPVGWATALRVATILGVLSIIALVNFRGVARGGLFVTVLTGVKLLPLLVLVALGAGAIHGANLTLAPVGSPAIGHAVLLSLFTFMGMESALVVSGEVARPNRTIPRALLLAIGAATGLYIAIQIVAQGVLGSALASSTTPLADAMSRIHPSLRGLLLAGAAVSMLGWLGADVLASPRILFAIARDGRLPGVLGRLSGKTHTPDIAILIYVAVGALLALTGTFGELAVLSALASAVLYVYICLAAWRLQRRGVALAGTPLNFRWLKPAVGIGIGSMILMIALASGVEILGLALLVGLAVVLYLIQGRGWLRSRA